MTPGESGMAGKSGMAEEEKEHRVYRETYGRGGGESFEDRDYPRSYAGAGGTGWRRALQAYVDGHDRGWETERKEREAAARVPDEEPESPTGRELVPASGEPATGSRASGETGEGAPGETTARTEEGTRFGVAIPDRHELRFHRSASVWRDRLPDASRLPRHTDRRLDTSPGRGGQA